MPTLILIHYNDFIHNTKNYNNTSFHLHISILIKKHKYFALHFLESRLVKQVVMYSFPFANRKCFLSLGYNIFHLRLHRTPRLKILNVKSWYRKEKSVRLDIHICYPFLQNFFYFHCRHRIALHETILKKAVERKLQTHGADIDVINF